MSSLPKEKNNRILVLDDEEDVRDFLCIYLKSLGWDVTPVASTQEAFAALDAQAYFLVLADIAMPDMDGFEFIGALHERGVSSQVALMTGFGYNPRHTLVKIYKTIKYPCLFKPFNRTKVTETVQNAFTAYHADLENPGAAAADNSAPLQTEQNPPPA
ncbi:MAG: response regulator [Chitinivibrionales bacterium]|nr:response regulator [Chitinivibrionales bacterium]